MSASPTPSAVAAALSDARGLAAAGNWPGLVARVADIPDDQLRAEPELAYLAADAHHRVGQVDRALLLATAVEAAARLNGDRRLALRITNLVGVCHFAAGRLDEAEERFGELMELALNWQDEEFAARASNNLGVIAGVRGRRELALTNFQRALAAYQQLGHLRGLAQTHHNLGNSYRELGFLEDADTHFCRAIEYGRQMETEDIIAFAETERAMLRVRSGDGVLAESLAMRALERFERLGDGPRRAEVFRVLAAAARADGRDLQALGHLDEALAIARAFPIPLLLAEVQRDRGMLLLDRGERGAGIEALTDAAQQFARIGAGPEAEAVRLLLRELGTPGAVPPGAVGQQLP